MGAPAAAVSCDGGFGAAALLVAGVEVYVEGAKVVDVGVSESGIVGESCLDGGCSAEGRDSGSSGDGQGTSGEGDGDLAGYFGWCP